MSRVHIRHRTVYRYSAPVSFGLHRLVLRPRENHDVTVSSHRLYLEPRAEITWMNDVFGNHVAFARFLEKADELVIDSHVTMDRVDQGHDTGAVEAPRVSQVALPLTFLQSEQGIAEAYATPTYPEEQEQMLKWAQSVVGDLSNPTALDAVQAIVAAIYQSINYRRREEAGVQSPARTLELATGSCRDMATLAIEAVRSLGVPARFVSGYLNSLSSLAGHGSSHAWMDAYLPDCGWCGFDATSGKPTSRSQIPVGVSSHPRGVMPVSGKFDNSTGSSLGMSVSVSIRHESIETLKSVA
jgi:transglutaminase-like putative cysteine protease